MRRLAIFALMGLVACTRSSTEGSAASTSLTPASVTPTSTSLDATAVAGDRLVVLRDDGNLVTMDPNGGHLLALTTDAGPEVVVDQPVASPDGRSVAWVELRADGPHVVTTSRAGGNRRDIPLSVAPFFLAWDPTSTRIAYLGNAGAGVGLGVIDDAVVQPRDIPVGGGTPLYIAWSPDGSQLLVHVGVDGLGRTDLVHPLRPTGDTPGTFQAPAWLSDGRELFVAREGATRVARRAGGRRPDDPAPLSRRGAARAEPDGTRVAYRLDAPNGAETGVFVQDLDGGPPTRVTGAETIASFWSPDGDRLLLLTGDPNGGPFRWRVWQGRERFVGQPFVPSATFARDYLPFFDQYAQTITPWAPDGSSFAYAGEQDGRSGIWVQPLAGAPRLIADGGFVTWAPAPAD